MVEGIGMGGGLPDHRHRTLYKRWGEGEWGMIITGMSISSCIESKAEARRKLSS